MSSTPRNQSADPGWRPPEWLIPKITKVNVWVYRKSNGKFGSAGGGMKQLLLSVKGRRSGNPQTVTLPYWYDSDDTLVVVASFGGAEKSPAWFHNVADRAANPTVTVQIRDTIHTAVATVLEGEEHEDVWARLSTDRPNYQRYQDRTERTIPLVRLTLQEQS